MSIRRAIQIGILPLIASMALAGSKQADTQPMPLPAEITVQSNAYITAGLIPPHVVNDMFGKAVGNSFAVVEVIVANRSDQARLVLHGLSIDYSRWKLGACPAPSIKYVRSHFNVPAPARVGDTPGNPIDPYQVATRPCEVPTVEVRAVRQIAQNGQLSSWRNQVLRYLKAIGDIGGGLTVAAGLGPVLPRAVDGYTTGVIPAFEFAFPDKTINQINLLNDTAFSVNTVIPKQSSVMVFAFFPIERFLGKSLMKYFIDDTALFFSPVSFLVDSKYDPFFIKLLDRYADPTKEPAGGNRLNYTQNPELARILGEVTLNHLTVIAQGVYVVNVEDVAADLAGVDLGGKHDEDVFAKAGEVKGSLRGRLMTGGVPVLQDADKLGVTIDKIDEGSDENVLPFKLTLTKPIPEQTLTFSVTKQKQGAADLVSKPLALVMHYPFKGAPAIIDSPNSVKTGAKVELTGKNIFDSVDAAKQLSVIMRKKGTGLDVEVPADSVEWVSPIRVNVTLPASVDAGEWQIILRSGKAEGPARGLKVE